MRYMIATVVEVDDEAQPPIKPEDIRAFLDRVNRGDGIYVHTGNEVMCIRRVPREEA